jgi:hypothetical protein
VGLDNEPPVSKNRGVKRESDFLVVGRRSSQLLDANGTAFFHDKRLTALRRTANGWTNRSHGGNPRVLGKLGQRLRRQEKDGYEEEISNQGVEEVDGQTIEEVEGVEEEVMDRSTAIT